MNLYKFGGAIAVLVCLVTLVFSYLSWQDKLQQAAGTNAEASGATESTESETETTQTEPDSDELVNNPELFENMDERVRDLFLSTNTEGETLQLLIAGSEALESGEPGYAKLLTEALEEAYGDSIEVTIESATGTSDSLQRIDLSAGYDLVLLEPMTLMNNDHISIEDEREDVRDFLARLQEVNADSLVVLHPPQPIYGAGHYLAQVQALGEFAKLYSFPYINHWSAWPATDDLALKEHLTKDAVPNNAGAKAWASELINYFIAN
ncbi:SGNH/GDSL hydrolase family protein [Planococcus sp. ISL-109]|uniref:SGNH/GDSL hydrolase family protein n=1 Tax=Planococcus sp. ISL-109 TaxID=2819166 RepID=UPI001BE74531|nr:SGNH/GDSL hydrolase family protein [Planococcus sp. ISL-109]MBT2581237.1 SGNH/GDSL hydrolase family protein [Planococcus sp. ISL-109]